MISYCRCGVGWQYNRTCGSFMGLAPDVGYRSACSCGRVLRIAEMTTDPVDPEAMDAAGIVRSMETGNLAYGVGWGRGIRRSKV